MRCAVGPRRGHGRPAGVDGIGRSGRVLHLQGLQGRRDEGCEASAALAKDINSNNWAVIKKDLLASFKAEASAEKEFDASLSAASSKVKSAAAVVVRLQSTFTTIAQSSSSLTGYETGIAAAQGAPKVKAALKVLDSYTTARCGATNN